MKMKRILAGMGVLLCLTSGCGGNENTTLVDNQTETEEIRQDTASEEVDKENVIEIPDFYSPEMEREMVVRIYLPPNYAETTECYPVIYMPDGQNLFSSSTASYGKEWCMDETLDQMYQENRTGGVIVVGVDSDEYTRTEDYNLYLSSFENGGVGNAAKVAEFFANTLKPYVDENYRTLGDQENTAIIGSSYGAVVSICASIDYPEVYGYTGAFSYCDNQNPARMNEYLKTNLTQEAFAGRKIYFFVGANDFARTSTEGAYEIALENEIENVILVSDENGDHDENTWSKYVVDCLEFFGWL